MKRVSLALLALFTVACATTQIDKARQAIVIGVTVYGSGVEGLNAIDESVTNDLIKKYRNGQLTKEQAIAAYEAWEAKYTKAQKALVILWDSLKTAAHVASIADAKLGGDVTKAWGDLLAAIAAAVDALKAVGVTGLGV